jgi:hypothetical protein
MRDITLDEVLKLAEQLTAQEQAKLIERLQEKQETHPPFNFPVIDLGPWPENVSLRREDWYDDDGG